MSNSYTLTINVDAVNQASEQAFAETALLLGREFSRVITEPRNWKGFEDFRDIVDTGRLRSSQQMVFTAPLTAVFSWNLDYAAPVHEGYTLRNGQRVEGRPWTEIAVQQIDVQRTFAEIYRQKLGS